MVCDGADKRERKCPGAGGAVGGEGANADKAVNVGEGGRLVSGEVAAGMAGAMREAKEDGGAECSDEAACVAKTVGQWGSWCSVVGGE